MSRPKPEYTRYVTHAARRRRDRRRGSLARSLAAFLVAGCLAVLVGLTVVAYAVGRTSDGKVLPGVSVAGVGVGGMRPAQAVAAVERALDPQLERTLTIASGAQSVQVTPKELGVRPDIRAAVRQALAQASATNGIVRGVHSLLGWHTGGSIAVHYVYPTPEIKGVLARLAASIDRAPRDASLQATADDTAVAYTSASPGRRLRQAAAIDLVLAALKHGATIVHLPVAVVPPKVDGAQLGTTITVDLSTNTLRLWKGVHVVRTYPVATAIQPYSTPIGTWQVAAKDLHPVWINPGTAWADSMPKTIPPGPANPLGLRALQLNAPGILIHGTPEDSSIGHWASHGCVRMHESDVLALYPLVPVGTKVIIYGAPP